MDTFPGVLPKKNLFPLPKWKEIPAAQVDARADGQKGKFVSEKYDGWRCLWDGERFWTRGRKVFKFPKAFLDCMPKGVPLDGEIFVGRAAGHSAIPALKASPKARGWRSASFRVFDYPGQAPFSERYEALLRFEAKLDPKCRKIIKVVRQKPVTSGTMLKRVLRQVLAKGGEGVVLTAPQARWAARQKIKIKGLQDMEARIVGYKLTVDGTMKSVHVKHDKVSFFVGIGFTKQERKDFRRLYPVGSWLKVAFERYSHRGVPLKPRAIGLRHKEDMV